MQQNIFTQHCINNEGIKAANLVGLSYFSYLSFFHLSQMGFPGESAPKESACNAEDPGSIPGLGGSPGEGNSYPL